MQDADNRNQVPLRPVDDDMGMKNLPKQSGEYLFEIIMRRYETRSTIMTSNRPLEDWGKLVGDVPSATAILDRFLHHAELISITGRSYRLQRPGSDLQRPDVGEGASTAAATATPEPSPDSSKPAKAPSGSGSRIRKNNPQSQQDPTLSVTAADCQS